MSAGHQAWAFLLAWALCLFTGLGLAVCFNAGGLSAFRRWALAAPLGLALFSVLLIFLVQVDVTVSRSAVPLAGCLGLAGLATAFAGRQRLKPRSVTEEGELRTLGLAQLGAVALLLLPLLLGGINYFVFRGNKWDCYGYNSMALALDSTPLSKLATATLQELADLHPATVLVHEHHLHDRLGVGAVLAFFARIAALPAADFQTGLSALYLALCAPLYFILGRGQGLGRLWAGLLAVALSVGFWGGFVQDDNQLAHLHSQPLLLLVVVAIGLLPRTLGTLALALGLAALAATNATILPFVLLGLALWWYSTRKAPLARARFAMAGVAGVAALGCIATFAPFVVGHLRLMAGALSSAKGTNLYLYHYPWLIDASTPLRAVPAFWSLEPLNRRWALYWGLAWLLCIVAGLGLLRQARGKAGFMGRSVLALAVAQALNSLWLLVRWELFMFCRSVAYGFVVLAPTLAAATGGRRPRRWTVWVVALFSLIQIGWAGGQVLGAARGQLDVPKFPTHLDSKEREVNYDWRPFLATLAADPVGVLALDISLPWVQERAEHVFSFRPLWRVRTLNDYHPFPRQDGLRMTRPARIEWALVEKRRYPRGVTGASLAAETAELGLYKLGATADFKPLP